MVCAIDFSITNPDVGIPNPRFLWRKKSPGARLSLLGSGEGRCTLLEGDVDGGWKRKMRFGDFS